ncbi:intracellular protein transport protein USO1 isoform X5 [Manduca sexta]|uniref:intracellular protein transport protein USO1 isoform X5 n=1 Tax=Manduca sexta TaxID=7130 RepID=UPI00188FBCA1|nr:intracellular protein transport protein USO1 isoform X5 [Manduca sexta]
MELQALLVLCGLGVAGVAVLLLMGLFSASGTSYEEAVAQQRRAATELLALAENKNKVKKNNSKKANKKLAKKEKNKESAAATTGSEQESEAPAESGMEDDPIPPAKSHVEFSPPVVGDIPKDSQPNVKIRKRGEDSKVKPILLNKDDPSCISDPSAVPINADATVLNHFEEMHPKDEFELLHSSLVADKLIFKIADKPEEVVEKKDNKPSKPSKSGKVTAKAPAPAEPVKEEPARERHNSGDAPKEPRKGKKAEKKAPNSEVVEAGREEVVPPLNAPQPTELTTEKLLKQALGATTAAAVAAPVAAAPAPAPAPAPSAPAKNKKKKAEPNVLSLMAGDSGGVNVGELVRVVREAALSRTEIQILTDALLNKHHDPLPQHSEWTEGPNDPVQKLKKQLADKEKALADEVDASQALQAKLKELRASLNAERSRAAAVSRASDQQRARADHAAAELHALQARLQRLADDNHALAQDKLVLQAKLGAEGEAQAQRVQLEMHIQRLSESEGALMAQLAALQAELSAHALEAGQARCELAAARDSLLMAQQHAADLAQQLQDSSRAYADLDQLVQQERRQAQERIHELQNEVQRLANRAQTAETNLEKLKEESEKQQQQLSNEISSLSEQLAARESELAELKQMKAVPAQNGLPTANENEQKAAELAKVESVVEALRGELAAAQRGSRDQRDQLARLHDQLRAYQDKNNEAIKMAQETQYNEVANVLRAVCPSAAPGSSPDKQWLQTFADNLKAELEKKTELAKQSAQKEVEKVAAPVCSATSDERVGELVSQNEHLQSLVDKYKRIIDDTEGVLSRLQQNVTTEEQRWAQQLADKQRELDELRQRTVLQMQKKIDALQEELQQAHATNKNNSFADAERFTQERLMADLSNKHVDVSNGPLQMGLSEK